MANHVSDTSNSANANNGAPHYVYPDGRVYGAPYVEPESAQSGESLQGAVNAWNAGKAWNAWNTENAQSGAGAAGAGMASAGAAGTGEAFAAGSMNSASSVSPSTQMPQDVHAYGRDKYMGQNALATRHSKRSKKKRIIGAVAGVFLGLLLIAGIGVGRYLFEANRALGHEDTAYASSVAKKLSPVNGTDAFYTLILAHDTFAIKEKAQSNTDVIMLARI
ncbi:MAG: hypothetical protein IJ113_06315, partial [Eggerthellaceae bacterium]|nr:hypothetical protein [Eggerthellaceae bacterium]